MKKMRLFKTVMTILLAMVCFFGFRVNTSAFDVPRVSLSFDKSTQTVIISNVEFHDEDNSATYELHGTLYFNDGTLVEAVSISEDTPYDVPEEKAYKLTWTDREFLLPASGDYTFKAWLTSYNNETGAKNGRSAIETVSLELKLSSEEAGWYSARKAEIAEEEKCEYSEDTLISVDKLMELKESGQKLKIKGEDYEWTVNGSSIIRTPNKDVSLETKFEMGCYTKRDVKNEFGDIEYVPINISYNGLFGFDAVLEFKVPDGNAERFANLFYVPGTGVFSYVDSMEIPEDGKVSFSFVHASDYLVTITDEPYDPYVGVDVIEKKVKTIEEAATPQSAGIVDIQSTHLNGVDGEYADREVGAVLEGYSFYNRSNSHRLGVFATFVTVSALISYFIIRRKIKTHKGF